MAIETTPLLGNRSAAETTTTNGSGNVNGGEHQVKTLETVWAPAVKLNLGSVKLQNCLEFWYLMVLLVITGRLSNPLIPVDAISICMNIQGWDAMIAIGFNAAIRLKKRKAVSGNGEDRS
ncbi:hypothetical protein Ddye_006988 [Dipteronia dyeriana]|uniref:Uncharacterized protein n=1 Tax=Dipteronia dyeriana TaxID=168575 RepID=A0AAD9XJJ0_9ROSI|nr:hypothetical protein Ddye_006988 [Dipteronia dyeriana]